MDEFVQYRRTQIAEMADWAPGFDMTDVSVSEADRKAGSPRVGDKIARNPANHEDRWLVAAGYFAANFEPIASAPQASQPPQGAEADRIVRMVLEDMEICAGESPRPDWESQELSTETVEALIAYEKAARFNSEAEQSALQHRSAAPSHPLFPCLIGYVSAETVKSLQNAEWLSRRGVSAQLWGTDSPPSRATIPVYLLAQQADTRAALAAPPQGASSLLPERAARAAKAFDELIDSIEVFDGKAVFDYARMLDVRDALAVASAASPLPAPQEPADLIAVLRGLAANAGALRAFETEVRAVIGNSNWGAIASYVEKADALLALYAAPAPDSTP